MGRGQGFMQETERGVNYHTFPPKKITGKYSIAMVTNIIENCFQFIVKREGERGGVYMYMYHSSNMCIYMYMYIVCVSERA